jgi:dihydrofolate reductase
MGKLIVTEFVTLDGVAQSPGEPDEDRDDGFSYGGWQAPLLDAKTGGVMFERAQSMDALLLGRRTYDIFAAYWPQAPEEIPFTGLLNRVPKYVVSRTLSDPLEWQGSSVVPGDPDGIAALKDRHDEVHVIGSLGLVQSLLGFRVIDRFSLWLYPLVLGSGKRVFGDGTVPTALRLAESVNHPNGVLELVYEPSGEPTTGNLGVGADDLQRLADDG